MVEMMFSELDHQLFALRGLQAEDEAELRRYGIARKAYQLLHEADQSRIDGHDARLVVRRGLMITTPGFRQPATATADLCFSYEVTLSNNKVVPRHITLRIAACQPDRLVLLDERFSDDEAAFIDSRIRRLEQLRDAGVLPDLDQSCTGVKQARRAA